MIKHTQIHCQLYNLSDHAPTQEVGTGIYNYINYSLRSILSQHLCFSVEKTLERVLIW